MNVSVGRAGERTPPPSIFCGYPVHPRDLSCSAHWRNMSLILAFWAVKSIYVTPESGPIFYLFLSLSRQPHVLCHFRIWLDLGRESWALLQILCIYFIP